MEKQQTNNTDSQQSQKNSVKKPLFISLIVIILIVIAAGVVYVWQQSKISSVQDTAKERQVQIDALTSEMSKLSATSKENTSQSNEYIISPIAGGKQVKYPVNKTNSSIIWWQPSDNLYILSVSSQKVLEFVTSIPSAKLKTVCGDDAYSPNAIDLTMLSKKYISIKDKKAQNNQYASCIDLLASQYNKDSKSSEQAKAIISEVNKDIDEFVSSLTIE